MIFTLHKNEDLSPISLDAYKESIYETFQTVDNLHSKSGSWGLDDFAYWEGSTKCHQYVEELDFWPILRAIYQYAELGEYSKIDYSNYEEDADWFWAGLVKRIAATWPVIEFDGEAPSTALIKVLTKYRARLKLDFFDGYLSTNPNESNDFYEDHLNILGANCWFINYHKDLNITELALLAGVKNQRSIRNAQYDKKKLLPFYKEGNTVLIPLQAAKEFLSLKPKFKPSKNI